METLGVLHLEARQVMLTGRLQQREFVPKVRELVRIFTILQV